MKIALISDIHFGSQATNNDLVVSGQKCIDGHHPTASPFFKGVIDTLKNERPDYLFIAGDLTSTADPLEYEQCYRQLLRLESEAEINHSNWFVCLGNHDVDRRISDLHKKGTQYKAADKTAFSKHYLDTRTNDLATHSIIKVLSGNFSPIYEKTDIPLVGVVDRNDCIVFVLNSGYLCTAEKAGGKLGNNQLRWFETAAAKCSKLNVGNDKPKIVLIHHHPYNLPYPIPVDDLSTLTEGADIQAICGNNGIELVIHGHRHHPIAETVYKNGWIKPVTFICAGSLSVEAKERLSGVIKNTFHIIDYVNAGQIILRTYAYDITDGWKKMNTRDIDDEVMLGRCIQYSEVEPYINNLPVNEWIEYSTIHEELKYFSYEKLNGWIKDIHKKLGRRIEGKFPDNVRIDNI